MSAIPEGYKQTEVGVIPKEWAVACVGDSFDVCNQFRLPISQEVRERMSGIYPYYGPTGIQGWINEYRVDGEYALIGEDGDHFLKWGSQPMTLLVRGKFNVNNHAHLIRGSKNLTEWFYWFFANRDITPFLSRQGAGRYKLNKVTLLKLPCVLPPLPEQRAIATTLSDVDALLAKLDQFIAKKRDLKQATMQQLLTGQTRLPGFSGEWETKSIGELCDYQNGTSLEQFFNQEDGFKVISIGNYSVTGKFVDNGVYISIKHRKLVEKFILRRNDLTMSLNDKTSVGAIIGRVLLIDQDDLFVFNQRTMRLRPKEIVSPSYLHHAVNADRSHSALVGLAKPGTQIYINTDDVIDLKLSVPPLPEQTAIATVLSDMDAELAALEARRDKTRALKQGMMQELLTGRIRLV